MTIETTSQDKLALKIAKATHNERLKSFPDTMKKHRYQVAKHMLSRPAPKFGRLTLNLVGYNKLTWD